MPALLTFNSSVNQAGYDWVPGGEWNLVDGVRYDNFTEPRWLVPTLRNAIAQTPRMLLRPRGTFASRRWIEIQPTAKDSGLFRNFAATEPTPEAIIDFANVYGPLWETEVGEPFHKWEYEIRTMRFLIEVSGRG